MRTWTKTQENLLKELYLNQSISVKDIAKQLGKTVPAIKCRVVKLNLSRSKIFEWNNTQLEILKQNYPFVNTQQVADSIGCSIYQARNKAHELGLKKDISFLRQMANTLRESGKAHQYKKGHTPANKGKKISKELKEKLAHTYFKKGHTPANTKFNGAITKRRDKTGRPYYFIRLAKAKWELCHRYLWEKANGPIPNGCNIVFKDGNTLNCVLENLECLTDKELMEKNTIQRYPEELKTQIRKVKKLSRLIKKIQGNGKTNI